MIPLPRPRGSDAPPPRRPRAVREAVGRLGLTLFLVSMTVFFVAATWAVLYALGARGARPWRIPAAWWWATAWLLAASAAAETAYRAVRRGRQRALLRWCVATVVLGGLFLLVQTINVVRLTRTLAGVGAAHAFAVALLGGLHGAHIAGLVGYTAWVGRAVQRRRVHWGAPMPVRHAAVCWHFLGAMWLFVLAVVAFATSGAPTS